MEENSKTAMKNKLTSKDYQIKNIELIFIRMYYYEYLNLILFKNINHFATETTFF
jgi:hypothetical protein